MDFSDLWIANGPKGLRFHCSCDLYAILMPQHVLSEYHIDCAMLLEHVTIRKMAIQDKEENQSAMCVHTAFLQGYSPNHASSAFEWLYNSYTDTMWSLWKLYKP